MQFWGALFHFLAGLFHSLRPNIINGSFAYHNHPPISVSFTTNFQNINVGYGAFGIPLRIGGRWLPELLHAQNAGGQQLSPCLRDALRQFFPQQSAQGTSYSPIDDARFNSGIPGWVKAAVAITPGAIDPVGITLGLYDIHYDPNSVNINGGTNESLYTILEEVSHSVQFLQVWAGLKKNMMVLGKWGVDTTTYSFAQDAWKEHYAYNAVKGLGYDNDVERWAKNNASAIMQRLVSNPQLQRQGNLCGFDLTNYRIEFIR